MKRLYPYEPLGTLENDIREFKRYEEGSTAARDRLIFSVSALVVVWAKRAATKENGRLDWQLTQVLAQEMMEVLLKKIHFYAPGKRFRFTTFVGFLKRTAQMACLVEKAPIHGGNSFSEALLKQKMATDLFYGVNGRNPTEEELAYYTNKDTDVVRKIASTLIDAVPIERVDHPLLLAPDTYDIVEQRELRSHIRRDVLEALENSRILPLTRRMIYLRFGLEDGKERTFEQVGAMFSLSGEDVRQRMERAWREIFYSFRSKKLQDHL